MIFTVAFSASWKTVVLLGVAIRFTTLGAGFVSVFNGFGMVVFKKFKKQVILGDMTSKQERKKYFTMRCRIFS